MKFGKLNFSDVSNHFDLVAESVERSVKKNNLKDVLVAEIDPDLADTAAFCARYGVAQKDGANCVIVKAIRGERTWFAAVLVDGDSRADINGVVRKHLDARKISFAPMDEAVELTGMEFGGITPIGLPNDWSILVDEAVAKLPHAIIGSGVRKSKLLVSGELLTSLPNATVLDLVKK
ncbi:YbaK/EbsC family protein [Candidatus Saccharibacteria bacterium]|nr:YbaK/EbsC family protein [Candidatus Saccharibacteria bacterium]